MSSLSGLTGCFIVLVGVACFYFHRIAFPVTNLGIWVQN